MLRRDDVLPALALTANAFVWGVSWWPLRQLQGMGLHPLWATACIYVIAVGALTLTRPGAWPALLRTPALWLIALASGTTNAAFNWAVTVGDVVRVVLLFYLMPVWAVLLARALLGERLRGSALARVALALAGAAIVLWPAGGGVPWPRTLAEVLGIVGGFTFALNNVMLRRESALDPSSRALAMFCGGALVSGVLAAAGLAPLPAAPGAWLLPVAALAAFFLASNLALQYGAARLPAHATAVIMLTEVVFAAVSALALGGGTWSAPLALGGACIVAAAVLAALGPRAAPH